MTPDKFTNREFFLDVGESHKLYVMDWGQPTAQPIIHCHGGPGGSSHDSNKERFDPNRQRVIFFDQRGCGASTPTGLLNLNTTDHLINDINVLADYLKIDEFILAGRSWGSLLALAYSIRHPKRVKCLVIGGVLIGSQAEKDYIETGGFKTYFPRQWADFLKTVPGSKQTKPVEYHCKRIIGDNQLAASQSAAIYSQLMSSLLRLDDRPVEINASQVGLESLRIEASYYLNNYYLPSNYVLKNAGKLRLPIWIVQGRYDMVCPPVFASRLDEALPNSNLIWTMSGHSASSDRSNYDVFRTILLATVG